MWLQLVGALDLVRRHHRGDVGGEDEGDHDREERRARPVEERPGQHLARGRGRRGRSAAAVLTLASPGGCATFGRDMARTCAYRRPSRAWQAASGSPATWPKGKFTMAAITTDLQFRREGPRLRAAGDRRQDLQPGRPQGPEGHRDRVHVQPLPLREGGDRPADPRRQGPAGARASTRSRSPATTPRTTRPTASTT